MFDNIIDRDLDPAKYVNAPEKISRLIDDALRSKDMLAISAALRTVAHAKSLSRVDCDNDNAIIRTLDEKMRSMSCVGLRLHLNREPEAQVSAA